jgi:hypothetical protein
MRLQASQPLLTVGFFVMLPLVTLMQLQGLALDFDA